MKTTLDELVAFAAVVDTGSVTAAAGQLAQTVSGVSRALRRLEEKLQTPLLRRSTRRLELTEEGRVFLAQARKILEAVDQAEEQMTLRRQRPAGRLRINAASPFMLHAIVPLTAEFRALYPEIGLVLNSSDEIADLLEHRTDVAIRVGMQPDTALHVRALGSYRLRVLASPAYLKRHGKPAGPADLARHSLLGFTQPERLNHWPLRHALGDSLQIAPTLQASSAETLRQLALAGQGLVCLADFMTRTDLARGDLLQVLVRETVEVRQAVHAVYYRNTQLAARITCFLDFLGSRLGAV